MSGNTSPHNPLLSPVSPREPPPFRSIASGLELNKRGRRNSNIEFYRNAGGLCPESDQRICRGGRRERKRARGNERSAGENNRQSLFIFHLVPVSLLLNNFPYVRFTLTTKKNFPNVTFIGRVSPSRGHDFSANARPLTCHIHILFFFARWRQRPFLRGRRQKNDNGQKCGAAGSDTRALGIHGREREVLAEVTSGISITLWSALESWARPGSSLQNHVKNEALTLSACQWHH